MGRPDPRTTIEDLRRLRFPQAVAVFLAGSVMRGQGTPHSDLDVVVVLAHLPSAYRESLFHLDWPVELFVHDPETLAYFFADNRQRGVPSLAAMVAEGLELPESTPLSQSFKEQAHQLLRSGPPLWSRAQINEARYFVSDLCDDLRQPHRPEQLCASGCRLYETLANFTLRANGQWSATGKSIPERLDRLKPGLAQTYTSAFEELFGARNPGPILALAELLLEPFGGMLFCQPPNSAPPQWRLRPGPQLSTQRLQVRMGVQSDVAAVLAYLRGNQARLQPLEPDRPTNFCTVPYWQDALQKSQQEFSADAALRLFVFPQQSKQVIGMIHFSQMFRGSFQACTLGYSLDLEWEGQGIMFEALQAALDYVFEELGFHRVMANYLPENARSGRLLQRLGFVVEGRASQYLHIGGQWRDHVLTALTRSSPEH